MLSMYSPRDVYTVVEMNDHETDSDDVKPETSESRESCGARQNWFNALAIVFVLGCTVINTWALTSSHLVQPSRPARLPRPNQYIGLERVHWNVSRWASIPPIINYPPILTQINRRDPHRVYPIDSRRWYSWLGTVSPDDRQLLVNANISSIAQFRVYDYGLETCEFMINIPTFEELQTANKSVRLTEHSSKITVWKLAVDDDLDLRTLSWSTRPRSREKLATLDIKVGQTAKTPFFRCPSESLQTFELSCDIRDDCHLEFWQDKNKPMLAAVLVEHPSMN